IRCEARAAGFVGPLRGGLEYQGLGRRENLTRSPQDRFVADVGALLPGLVVKREGHGRRLVKLVGISADDSRTIHVRVPNRDDLIAELVASTIDTSLQIKHRFGSMASGIRLVSFDHGEGPAAKPHWAGLSVGSSGVVFLSPVLICADLIERERRRKSRQ